MVSWTAIVLTGGGSTRLGRDKAGVTVVGRRMIDRVLDGIGTGVPVVVVGPDPGVPRQVMITREVPAGGGPAAGIAAGLALVETDLVAVIAADMPFAGEVVQGLLAEIGDADAAVAHADGYDNGLCAVYRAEALRGLDLAAGTSMRSVLAALAIRRVEVPGRLLVDIDTAEDLSGVRRLIMDRDGEERAMRDWVLAVKKELGLEADVDVDVILDVAKDAAHAVQRPAAPVTTYLLGLAVAGGVDPAAAAAKIAHLAQGWPAADA